MMPLSRSYLLGRVTTLRRLGSLVATKALPVAQCQDFELVSSFHCRRFSNSPHIDNSLKKRVLFVISASDSKAHIAPKQLFSTLQLRDFTEDEIHAAFDSADYNHSEYLERSEVQHVIRRMKHGRACGSTMSLEDAEWKTNTIMDQFDTNKDGKISWEEFHAGILALAQSRDPRMWPYAGSMVLIGISVGAIMPAMPLLIGQLGMTPAQFGYSTSAWGLAKLISNIPSGFFVDQYGRRSTLVLGCVICGLGYVGAGLASSVEQLILSRFVMGAGAAFTMTGSTMAVADTSNKLNRARMMAPVMSGFTLGNTVGPVLGGVLIGAVGIENTFFLVGGMFALNALGSQCIASETMSSSRTHKQEESVFDITSQMFTQWGPSCRDAKLRELLLVNVAYWMALSGAQVTVLPLVLTTQFSLNPAEIGMVFAMQSVASVLAAEPVARLADRVGPDRLLAPALATMAISVGLLPMTTDVWQALPSLIGMALGCSMLSSAPTAAVANVSSPHDRVQSLALMRTAGDAGWLLGGVSIGTIASIFGIDASLQSTSVVLLTTAAWFALRRGRT